jgi:tight adherence protein B
MVTILLVVLCSLGTTVGIVGLMLATRGGGFGTQAADRLPHPLNRLATARGRACRSETLGISLALAVGILVAVLTRWPVAGLFTAGSVFILPRAFKKTRNRDSIRRTEAIAVWTELVRDTLTASSGLAQAIVATESMAPADIRVAVGHLADRISNGVLLEVALTQFADEVGDPCIDDVVAALRLVATSPAQRLVDLLTALADSTRETVAMRLRVEASRASARSGVRTIIWFSLGFVLLLVVTAQSYLSPFKSLTGQLVLGVVGAFYMSGMGLMIRLVRPEGRDHATVWSGS